MTNGNGNGPRVITIQTSDTDSLKNAMALVLYGITHTEALARRICVDCKTFKVEANDFRDDLSRKEYMISALCQSCQDGVFGVDRK